MERVVATEAAVMATEAAGWEAAAPVEARADVRAVVVIDRAEVRATVEGGVNRVVVAEDVVEVVRIAQLKSLDLRRAVA